MLLALLLLPAPSFASSPAPSLLGDWITPDKSIVQIYHCGEAICMKIAQVAPAVGHSVDGLNPDSAKRQRPLCGLIIGSGFAEKDPGHADGGKLYDPHSGNTYSGSLALTDSSTLKLHGYIGISLFGRTELWRRSPISPPACS